MSPLQFPGSQRRGGFPSTQRRQGQRRPTFGRGAGIRTMAAFQSIGQMNSYPAKHQTILGSSSARIFMGTRDLDTARMVSDMIGAETLQYDAPRQQADATKAKTQAVYSIIRGGDPFMSAYQVAHFAKHESRKEKIRRMLLTPDEVLTFPETEMILLTSGMGCPPIRARKIPYWQRRELAGQYLPNPFHPPETHVIVKSIVGSRKRQVITQEVPRDLEHWPQFQ
jgi:type IV secretion system protein VirD4